MKIALVSKLWEETNSLSRGGTGASIGALVDGLTERGHKITLFATGNSKTKAEKLISVRPEPYSDSYSEVHEFENIASAFERHRDFDLIHCAVEHKSVLFGGLVETPSLHSIRYGEFFEQEIALLRKYKKLNFVANSVAVKKLLPFLNWQACIYNGVNPDVFSFAEKDEDYLLFLARLSPQKGVDTAIRVALASNKKLLIAGKISGRDKEYLEKKVLPFIDGEKIVYLGEVVGKKKIELLQKALVLLQPINFFEACSNTVLEANACGTPALVFDRGSNRELIKEGVNGYVVRTEKQMIKALLKIKKINRHSCRQHIIKNFSLNKMVLAYEKLYSKILKK